MDDELDHGDDTPKIGNKNGRRNTKRHIFFGGGITLVSRLKQEIHIFY